MRLRVMSTSLCISRSPLPGKSDVQDEDLSLNLGVQLGEDGLQLGHWEKRLVARYQREVVRDAHSIQKHAETTLSRQFSRQALRDESLQGDKYGPSCDTVGAESTLVSRPA